MKYLIFLLLPLSMLTTACKSQSSTQTQFTVENFDQEVLDYEPLQGTNVSDKDFKSGLFKLHETKKAVIGDNNQFTYADYWNLTMAFANLGESAQSIEIPFQKAIELNPRDVCAIIKGFGNSRLDTLIPDVFFSFVAKCPSLETKTDTFDLNAYIHKNNLDPALVTLMAQINHDDRQYREKESMNWDIQNSLDKRNQLLIDSLFKVHGGYVGKSKVGKHFESAMWAVVQHAEVDFMTKYLPVIHQAVKDGQLDVVPLKMLLDRYFGLTRGFQVFGTQTGFGFRMANESEEKLIKEKYGII